MYIKNITEVNSMFNSGNCSVPLVASIDGNGNNSGGWGNDGWGWIWIILIFALSFFTRRVDNLLCTLDLT